MFLFKRPSFGFPLLQAPAPQPPCSPPRGCEGQGLQNGLRFAFAVVTKNVRVAFLFYPAALFPGGSVGAKGSGTGQGGVGRGSPLARAGALLRSGGVPSWTLSHPLVPQGCGSPFGSRLSVALWSRCRARGHPARAAGRCGRCGGSRTLCPPHPLTWPKSSGVLAMLFFYHRVK